MIGTVLGNRYRLDELVGEGGMALVYKAECSLLQRPVAVKILRPQFASDMEFVERFRREAQAAARLSHPNVVNVYDVGQDQGLNYIVMEFVRGENLKELIRKEAPFTVVRALNIARQICEALAHAHHNNIIHRDIKPHNILMTPDGRVKVTDFGIARAVSASTLTQDGSVLGSVQYFSPEQAKGAPAGVASDIYSLGCVLFEMLTGTVPFKGETPIAIALKHLQEPFPSLRGLRPGLPPAVENLVARALAKDPAQRFPSALAMLKAIQAAAGQGEPLTHAEEADLPTQVLPALPPIKAKSDRRPWLFVGIAVVAVVILILVYTWWVDWSVAPEVPVPKLIGLSITDARRIAVEEGLKLEENYRFRNETRNTVYQQDPAPSLRIRQNQKIRVWVSNGPQEIKVPSLVGLTLEQARQSLRDLDLAYEEQQLTSTDADEGLVIRQEPIQGSPAAPGDTVKIYVSMGKKFIPDDYVGLTVQEATMMLDAAGLNYHIALVPSDQPEGVVVRQDPEPGRPVALGRVIVLDVANGQPPAFSGP